MTHPLVDHFEISRLIIHCNKEFNITHCWQNKQLWDDIFLKEEYCQFETTLRCCEVSILIVIYDIIAARLPIVGKASCPIPFWCNMFSEVWKEKIQYRYIDILIIARRYSIIPNWSAWSTICSLQGCQCPFERDTFCILGLESLLFCYWHPYK